MKMTNGETKGSERTLSEYIEGIAAINAERETAKEAFDQMQKDLALRYGFKFHMDVGKRFPEGSFPHKVYGLYKALMDDWEGHNVEVRQSMMALCAQLALAGVGRADFFDVPQKELLQGWRYGEKIREEWGFPPMGQKKTSIWKMAVKELAGFALAVCVLLIWAGYYYTSDGEPGKSWTMFGTILLGIGAVSLAGLICDIVGSTYSYAKSRHRTKKSAREAA